jgi:hypothetical protein
MVRLNQHTIERWHTCIWSDYKELACIVEQICWLNSSGTFKPHISSASRAQFGQIKCHLDHLDRFYAMVE